MKALSLHQPWATLCAIAGKHETRSWSTEYRGDLLICSTQNPPALAFSNAVTHPKIYERVRCAPRTGWLETYPHGVALVLVELVDCVPAVEWVSRESDLENGGQPWEVGRQRDMGDLSPGRFVWVLQRRRVLRSPVPVKGRQKLWTPDADLVAQVMQSVRRKADAS